MPPDATRLTGAPRTLKCRRPVVAVAQTDSWCRAHGVTDVPTKASAQTPRICTKRDNDTPMHEPQRLEPLHRHGDERTGRLQRCAQTWPVLRRPTLWVSRAGHRVGSTRWLAADRRPGSQGLPACRRARPPSTPHRQERRGPTGPQAATRSAGPPTRLAIKAVPSPDAPPHSPLSARLQVKTGRPTATVAHPHTPAAHPDTPPSSRPFWSAPARPQACSGGEEIPLLVLGR